MKKIRYIMKEFAQNIALCISGLVFAAQLATLGDLSSESPEEPSRYRSRGE